MFEKFTERARKVMSLARQEAQRLNNEMIDTQHILLGILDDGGGVGAKALAAFKVDLRFVRGEVEKTANPGTLNALGQMPFSPRSKRAIELAGEEACRANDDVIGTEHLLIGCLAEETGLGAQILSHRDVTLPALRDVIKKIKEQANPSPPPAPAKSLRVRVTFYAKSLGLGSPRRTLFVAGEAYVETGSLLVAGVTDHDRDETAAALATQRNSSEVYSVEIEPE